jgi:hypothetical protein
MDEELKVGLIVITIVIVMFWGAITILQWITFVNYDPCTYGSDHSIYWCYENSRYSLVETIINQGKWILKLRVI